MNEFTPADAAGPPGADQDLEAELDEGHALLDELASRIAHAIPSFLGLTVDLMGACGQITLTSVLDGQGGAQTSLGFSIIRPRGGSVRFTLYARRLGALTDLDADLTHLARRANGELGTPIDIRLDEELARPRLARGRAGVKDRSTRQRAEGVLIEEGVELHHVAEELRQRAADAGLDTLAFAQRMVDDQSS